MCRNRTPESEQVPCSRCGEVANPDDGWEHGWPLYGRLELGYHSCIGYRLRHGTYAGAPDDPDWQQFDYTKHPAVVGTQTAQRVEFEWGNGHKYDSTDRYRLCECCQSHLLHLLGWFFGMTDRMEPPATSVQREVRDRLRARIEAFPELGEK